MTSPVQAWQDNLSFLFRVLEWPKSEVGCMFMDALHGLQDELLAFLEAANQRVRFKDRICANIPQPQISPTA